MRIGAEAGGTVATAQAGIYADLGESWEGYPAEEDAMGLDKDGEGKASVALDRALFALSKRLRGTDTASRIRAEGLLTTTIEKSLQPPLGPFPTHQDVWTLSRDPEMRQRIVTTNFDTLFERADPAEVVSRACADLPPPLGTDFTGVLRRPFLVTPTVANHNGTEGLTLTCSRLFFQN